MAPDQQRQQRRDAIMAECARRGITIEQRGQSWLLLGPGVDLTAADLANLEVHDIAPYQPRKADR